MQRFCISVVTYGVREGSSICLVGWNMDQKVVIVSELEMPDMPWFNVEEGKSDDKEIHRRCRPLWIG